MKAYGETGRSDKLFDPREVVVKLTWVPAEK